MVTISLRYRVDNIIVDIRYIIGITGHVVANLIVIGNDGDESLVA